MSSFTILFILIFLFPVKAAGESLAEIWSESTIEGFPVNTEYITHKGSRENLEFLKGEQWKTRHVLQSQHMSQRLRYNGVNCCNKWQAYFLEFFFNRFARVLYIFDAEKKSTYLRALKAIHRYFKPMSETKI